jgi:hypothetical protein
LEVGKLPCRRQPTSALVIRAISFFESVTILFMMRLELTTREFVYARLPSYSVCNETQCIRICESVGPYFICTVAVLRLRNLAHPYYIDKGFSACNKFALVMTNNATSSMSKIVYNAASFMVLQLLDA